MPSSPTPQGDTISGDEVAELVADLEAQLGLAAGQLTRMRVRLRRQAAALEAKDAEIRYLRSRLPDEPDTPAEPEHAEASTAAATEG